ncbi:methyl-accepting chemotaxis protein [Paludibacterium paludis]|uniref:Methyl-accepting chemotaxis protein n=1 Tax=Paludibacterium paludis TaxID=1225769 RepID=A0A918P289_9NEIS|nr:methyl-accepting chemotaxis protein [Paludibacterium paludis]GGY14036.1 methyl-accepting chemotaxis protein [Paludibacterium paludis]
MKISHKSGLLSAVVLASTIGILSWLQYAAVSSSLLEGKRQEIAQTSQILVAQIENWLNGKLRQIDLVSEAIDSGFSPDRIQEVFHRPLLKKEFLLIFGGLDTDGKPLTNDPTWKPPSDWDARKRPWYPIATGSSRAVLTEPYADAATGEILISAVAKLTEKGAQRGAFGGDLSLQTIAKTLNTVNFDGEGYAFLLSAEGKIISHPNPKLNGKPVAELFGGQAPAFTPDLQEIEANGQKLMVSFTPLTHLDGTRWMVGIVLESDKVLAPVHALGWRSLIGALIGVAVSLVLLSSMMQRILRKPLEQLQRSLAELNSGDADLTRRVDASGNDEFAAVARELNGFLSYLQQLVGDIKSIAQHVTDSSRDSAGKSELSCKEVEHLETELNRLVDAMRQMADTAGEMEHNAQTVAKVAEQAHEEMSDRMQQVVQSGVTTRRMAEVMEETSQSMNELATFSQNIESIVSVITVVADQTNLLALNAAIEAARAGEAGRGFAVVADEVRKLASQTQQATQEIRSMIDQLQKGVSQAKNKMQESRDMANTSVNDSEQTSEVLARIKDAIADINEKNSQIARTVYQQSSATRDISQNAGELLQIGQRVSASAQSQRRLSGDVAHKVDEQDSLISRFRI